MTFQMRALAHPFSRTVAIALAAVLALAGVAAGPVQASSNSFSDVPRSHQFHTEISWLSQMRVTTGYADGTFKPRDAVTREAFAAFLYRLGGSPQVKLPSRTPFTDVPRSAKFYEEIVWLDQQGITTGWADGTFRPKDRISREAVAAFLYRLSGKPSFAEPSRSPFIDMTSRSKFYREVTWLADTGITTGYADGTFRPRSNVSREAIAAFLYRGSAPLHSDAGAVYAVGGKVFPGTYVSRPVAPNTPFCVWERRIDTGTDWAGMLGFGYHEGRSIATILPSDPYFASRTCVAWTPLRATSPNATTITDGVSAVGYHMRPGTYQAPGGTNCRWAVVADFTSDDSSVQDGAGDSTQQVRLRAGQGLETGWCGTWTRIGS